MDNYLNINDSGKKGVYLSQQQIDLLLITQIKSKNELIDFFNSCSQFSYKNIEDIIPSINTFDNNHSLELCTRELFKAYQDSLISYIDNSNMTQLEQAQYKLEKLGVVGEEKERTLSYLINGDISSAYKYLESIRGQEFIINFNRFMRDDFENVKSISYDEMVELNNRIISNPEIDTVIIASSKYDNVIYQGPSGQYADHYFAERALDYCRKTQLHMRYHALFDYSHLTNLVNSGKTEKDKDEILAQMKFFVNNSMQFINSHNFELNDGSKVINLVEIFNELVEYNKPANDRTAYDMAWEKYFGITTSDLVSCFDEVHKPDGVSFMYNETMLEESPIRRKKVEEVFFDIMKQKNGFIDKFGTQMHLTNLHGMNSNEPFSEINQVSEMFDLISVIQNGKDGISGVSTEITEFDIHIQTDTMLKAIKMIKDGQLSFEQIISMKQSWINNISNLANQKGIKFDRATYWSLIDSIDHNLCRSNIMLQKYGIQIPSVMAGLFITDTAKEKFMSEINKIDIDKIDNYFTSKELSSSIDKLKQLSKLSTRQMLELYSNDSKYSGIVETFQKQKMELLQQVKQDRKQMAPRIVEYLKKSFPTLPDQTISKLADEQFYRMSISKFLKPVISQVEKEYGTIIPEDKMEKFKGLADFKNIKLNFNRTNAEADSKNGQLIFNPNETLGNTVEEKIVMSMGVSIHESFHLLINMNKSQEQAMEDSERLKYIVSTSEGDKEVHFAPGKYGQVLNEGFVEKMSSEFAQRNRFYCMISPRYIPYVEVCSKIMEHDNSITPQLLFTKNVDAIREKMNPDIRTKYEEAERIAVINHFSVKEADKDSSLKNITSDNVKESWMEKKGVDLPKTKNDMFKGTLEIKREEKKENNNFEVHQTQEKKIEKMTPAISVKRGEEVKSVGFTRRSESEIQVANQIKQKNIIIKQQKEQQRSLQKPKVKTLTKNSSNGVSSISGFANILSLTLITALIGCAIIMVVFIILK